MKEVLPVRNPIEKSNTQNNMHQMLHQTRQKTGTFFDVNVMPSVATLSKKDEKFSS